MQPTVDDFRALARSSPWRWRTLHFWHRSGFPGGCEAWVRRPGELLVRRPEEDDKYVSGVPYSTSPLTVSTSPEGEAGIEPVEAPAPEPVFRPDGLVASRPDGWYVEHSDPMWGNYSWTAMLDPDELSHHVAVRDVRRADRGGRETWQARLVPEAGYDPRCGCCPLLWSEVTMQAEYGGDPERVERFLAEGFPAAHDVALDVETGVVARCLPMGGPGGASWPWLENDILEVDTDVDAMFDGR